MVIPHGPSMGRVRAMGGYGAGHPARLLRSRTRSRLRADVTVSAFNLGIDAASCGLPKEAGYAIDAGVLPASFGRSGCW